MALVVAALVLAATVASSIRAQEGGAPGARSIELGTRAPAPTTPPASQGPVQPEPSGMGGSPRTFSRIVAGVPFSFSAPRSGWVPGPIRRTRNGFRQGGLSISKSTVGPQGAEAIVFWTSLDADDVAVPCPRLLGPAVGRTAADLATDVAATPGTHLIAGPSPASVGGRPARYVALRVRRDVGCHPGFFFAWRDRGVGGPIWTRTDVGDTVRVWIVDVGGRRLFIEAETTPQAGPRLDREIRQIVGSIRFHARWSAEMVGIAQRFMAARNAYDTAGATSLLVDGPAKVQLMYGNHMHPDMFPVKLDHEELALAFEAERELRVRYEDVGCTPTRAREISCSFLLDTRLRRIVGLPPMRSSFLLKIHDGRIDRLSFPWLSGSFPSGTPVEFWRFERWLEAEHPEAGGPLEDGVLFRTVGQELIFVLNRGSLAALDAYLDEYESARSA